MRCENCGAELTGSEKFCIKCGMRLDNQDVKSQFGNVDEIYYKEAKTQEIRGENAEIKKGVNVLAYAIYIVSNIKTDKENYSNKYINFLENGNSKSIVDLLELLQIDIYEKKYMRMLIFTLNNCCS